MRYSYDVAGVVYSNDAYGNISTVTSPLSDVATMEYDAYGRVTSSIDPLTNESNYAYDDKGSVTQVTDPRGKITYFYYSYTGCGCSSSSGLLAKVKDPLNNETVFAYSATLRASLRTSTTAIAEARGHGQICVNGDATLQRRIACGVHAHVPAKCPA